MPSLSRVYRRALAPAVERLDRRFDNLGHLIHAVKNELGSGIDHQRRETTEALDTLRSEIVALRDETQSLTPAVGPGSAPSPRPSAIEILRSTTPGPTAEHRIAMTTSCRDADAIPKVDGAGAVVKHRGQSVQVMHNGLLVEHGGYYGDWMAEVITTLRGHHEPQEELVFHTLLERLATSNSPNPTMLELGCFWAYYSLWFRQRFPDGRAIAVEPDPDHLDVGRRNAALNDIHIDFAQFAAGAVSNVQLALPSELHPGRTHEIPTRSVADLLDDHAIDDIDLLHLDIQGAELGVLESCDDLVAADRIRFVVVSTHHHLISGDPLLHQRVLEWFHRHEAHIICEHSIAESFSGDGLVAASFCGDDVDLHVEVSQNRASTSLFRDSAYDLAALVAAFDHD